MSDNTTTSQIEKHFGQSANFDRDIESALRFIRYAMAMHLVSKIDIKLTYDGSGNFTSNWNASAG